MADSGDRRRLGARVRDKAPLLRWSTIRFVLGAPSLNRTGRVGDGREAALRAFVLHGRVVSSRKAFRRRSSGP